ncbi:translational activator GCN1-related domain containing protein [Babesia gibsoni]|uniref:Translational activator GCN1-related domain containing protein n=1 Tax=Babesia gibsoni TaxID=33632 RepID=A0AAD8LPH2_BABGI|nr:translational activator GCN1-related domain containing protein [Babesia gibsoni]
MHCPGQHGFLLQRGIRRISSGLLCKSDLCVFNRALKELKDAKGDSSDAVDGILDTLDDIAGSFNKLMYKRIVLMLPKHIVRLINKIARRMNFILRKHSEMELQKMLLLREDAGFFHLIVIDPQYNREEQLIVAKRLIFDLNLKFSPVFIRMTSQLLGSLNVEEFEKYIFPECIRVLKRGKKDIAFSFLTLCRHIKSELILDGAVDLIDNIKEMISQQSDDVEVFGIENIPVDKVKCKGSYSYVVSELIYLLSFLSFREPQCCIANYLKGVMEFLDSPGGGNIPVKESNAMLLLMLLPCHNEGDLDINLIANFVDTHRDTLKKIAKSHPLELVQFLFIQAIGRMIHILHDSDFEGFLIDMLVELARPLDSTTNKSKDLKTNDKVMHSVLCSLRSMAFDDIHSTHVIEPDNVRRLGAATNRIIQFCHDKPVYKSYLFEAMCVSSHLCASQAYQDQMEKGLKYANNKGVVHLPDILDSIQPQMQDPLSHIILCTKVLRNEHICPKSAEISRIMGMESVRDIIDAVYSAKKPNLYATMVQLFEEISSKKESIRHPVLKYFYRKDYVERVLRDFVESMQEHHLYLMLMSMLDLTTKGRMDKTLRMLRDVWLSMKTKGIVFSTLIHCVLFRGPLGGFESTYQLTRIINSKSCRQSPIMKSMKFEGRVIHETVLYCISEGEVPYILDHYLATGNQDISNVLGEIFPHLQDVLSSLNSFEKEDIEIYSAPEDKLYMDSRPYQPNLNRCDKKRVSNLTKQQLDDMRYNDQCTIRKDIATLVKRVTASLYVISRALAQRGDYLNVFIQQILMVCKEGLACSIVHSSFYIILEQLCPLCMIGDASRAAEGVVRILDMIYSKHTDSLHEEQLKVVLETVKSSSMVKPEGCALIIEIVKYILAENITNELKELALVILLSFLKRRIYLEQELVLDIIAVNMTNEDLHPTIKDTLNEAVKYLVHQEGIKEICKVGLSSKVGIVKEAVEFYITRYPHALKDMAEYVKLLGIDIADAPCDLNKMYSLVIVYINENAELLNLAPNVFVQYSTEAVMRSFVRSFKETDKNGGISLLRVMKNYLERLDSTVDHAYIFDALLSVTEDSSQLYETLECFIALSRTAKEIDVDALIEHVKHSMDDILPKSGDLSATYSLEASEAVALGVCATFMGYLQDKGNSHRHVKWNLELLLTLMGRENEFSVVEGGKKTAAIISSHARKCALAGEDEFINDIIAKQFAESFHSDFAIIPCVSLLKGSGLSYLKKHNVISKLKEAFSNKGNQRRLNFVRELATQFGRLFEPYVKEIFPCLLVCFADTFDQCQTTCFTVVGSLSPVGFRSILPTILESLGGYVPSVKLGCLMILWHVLNDSKLRPLVIKNICDIVKAVSPCTTDTQKCVKDEADRVLDSLVGLAGEGSILYPKMHSILKVLSHPSDTNISSTMQVLSDYSNDYPNGYGNSKNPIGLVELGLLEPILSRALRSRNGQCRESAVVFSSWLVYRFESYRELELFFSTLLVNLTDLLKDTLPEVRREAAQAIGSCANSFKKFGSETSKALIIDLINRLMKVLMESSTSLERCSAASGLAEALWAVDDEFVHGITTKILAILDSEESTPQIREGCLAVFNYLPTTCNQYMLRHLNEVLPRVVVVLCDPDERVRDMSCQVLMTVIQCYHSTATDILMEHLMDASKSREWQRRNLILPLLHKMNTLREDQRLSAELYIARYDKNPTVKNTSMAIWKGVNATRTLRQIFPIVLERVIEMLEKDDEEDLRAQAGECIADAIVRLGQGAIKDFIQAILSGTGAYKGRCIGIASLASNGKAGIEEQLPRILEFLKMCLSMTVSCHEAAMALSALATYFPTVVSDVLPSLVHDLFLSDDKDPYLVGIGLMIESHSACFEIVLREIMKPNLDVTRLALLEKVLCANKTKVVFSNQNVLVQCIKQLLVYYTEYAEEVMSSFSNFALLVKPDMIVRLMQVLIEMLNDITAGSNNDNEKSIILLLVSRVLELRDVHIVSHYGSVAEALSRYIFTDMGTLNANIILFDQLIKSAEGCSELDSLICAIMKYLSALQFSDDRPTPTTFPHTLPLMMTLLQKCLVKSNAKVEAAKCVPVVHKLAGKQKMGPFVLKTIGAIIRCLNYKCPSLLKISLLEAISALLHCDPMYVRVILLQLQSVLFKCISDTNSDVNMLIPANLRLFVQLAPKKADSVLGELFQLATDKVGKPTVKTAAICAIYEVLKVPPILSASPFEHMLHILLESSSADKQMICRAIGLGATLDGDFGTEWMTTLFTIIQEDPSALMVLVHIVSSDKGFTVLYQNKPKEFVDVLRQSLRSDVPSINQCGLHIFCHISKRAREIQSAREFVKAHINILPSGSKLPPNSQSQLLKIYKRFLRFEQKIPNFGSQLLYLTEAIYDVPIVKLEAEKVLLVLLGATRDIENLSNFVRQYSTSDKVEKILTEYATRVLLKFNKVDQLSDDEC